MKIAVDFDVCAGSGLCAGIAPEVFELDEGGFLHLLDAEPAGELAERLRLAAFTCPTGAISITAP